MSTTGTLTLTAPSVPSDPKQNVNELAKNPLERTWRSNKAGTVRLQTIPDFKGDKYAEREWAKVITYLVSLSRSHPIYRVQGTSRSCIQILGEIRLW